MPHNRDYLPAKDSELVVWSKNFLTLILANAEAWSINQTETRALQTAVTNFQTLQAQADSPAKNSIIVKQKNDAKKILKEKISELVNFRLKNPVITDAQRISLGLHIRDPKPSPIPVPTTIPEMNFELAGVRRLAVPFHDSGSSTKAKPYGVNGAVILYAVLSTPPKSIKDLNQSVLATRTPHIFEFEEEDRGKIVYFAICWQNEKGERGPCSEIVSTIIP
ncbi:MAG: hypothetical protein LBF88_06640 [Planctomycetaceae bacterium]|jgi:phosphoribosylformylglycinamidine (FGAM) synthase PurS component|nr:hypothetical protein [Planctomycetaceae bacterium]